MSDETTITIALITAATGLGGALLGAAGAVFGPLLVQSQDRRSARDAESTEQMRKAILRWSDANVSLAINRSDPTKVGALSEEINRALNELDSRFGKSDAQGAEFVNGAQAMSCLGAVDPALEALYFGIAGRVLLDWLRGGTKTKELVPFEVRDRVGYIELRSKDADWPGAAEAVRLASAGPSAKAKRKR